MNIAIIGYGRMGKEVELVAKEKGLEELAVIIFNQETGTEPGLEAERFINEKVESIMDALQGRAGGKKGSGSLKPIIPNDRQVYRVTLEKMLPPRQSLGLGHLSVNKYRR